MCLDVEYVEDGKWYLWQLDVDISVLNKIGEKRIACEDLIWLTYIHID